MPLDTGHKPELSLVTSLDMGMSGEPESKVTLESALPAASVVDVSDDVLVDVAASDTVWYSCHCALGYLRIGVVVGEAARSGLSGPLRVLQKAALLGEVELILQALELWQGIELDLYPLEDSVDINSDLIPQPDHPDTHINQPLELQIAHATQPDYFTVKVLFSADALGQFKAVDAELVGSLTLSWSVIEASLLLDEIHVGTKEFRQLAPGALVLLPRSFERQWYASAVVPFLDNAIFDVRFDIESVLLTFSGTKSDAPDRAASIAVKAQDQCKHCLQVRWGRVIELTPDLLIGDGGGTVVALAEQTHVRSLMAELTLDGQLIGSGTIGPIAAGYALFIDKFFLDHPLHKGSAFSDPDSSESALDDLQSETQ